MRQTLYNIGRLPALPLCAELPYVEPPQRRQRSTEMAMAILHLQVQKQGTTAGVGRKEQFDRCLFCTLRTGPW